VHRGADVWRPRQQGGPSPGVGEAQWSQPVASWGRIAHENRRLGEHVPTDQSHGSARKPDSLIAARRHRAHGGPAKHHDRSQRVWHLRCVWAVRAVCPVRGNQLWRRRCGWRCGCGSHQCEQHRVCAWGARPAHEQAATRNARRATRSDRRAQQSRPADIRRGQGKTRMMAVESALQPAYPALLEALEVHRDAEGGLLLIPVQGKLRRAAPGQERVSHLPYRAEGYLLDYLAELDGARSRAELERRFNERYGPLFGPPLAARCWEFIEQYRGRLFEIRATPQETPNPPRVTGSPEAYFPVHATLEIIETCNMTCDHCYYSSSPDKTGKMSLDDAVIMMDRLAAGGVRVIELTGGECTIHTDFVAILEHACRTFDIVAVLTNGYRLGTSDKIWNAIRSKDNLMVQV